MDQVVIYFISCKQLYSKQPFKNQRHPYHNSFRRADFSKLDILRRSKITWLQGSESKNGSTVIGRAIFHLKAWF